jgi:hypothetical protein
MSLVRVRMVDRHNLKSSSSVWSRDLFLLFIMFIAEKPASHRYDVETGRSASVAFFVMMGYSCRRDNQNQAVSIDELFSFGLLSSLISVSSFSSATFNSADSNAFNTRGSQSKEDALSHGKYVSMILLRSAKLCRSKSTKFLSSAQLFISSNISTLFSFRFWFPIVLVFLQRVNFISTSKNSFFPSLHTLVKSVKRVGMSVRKATFCTRSHL